MNADQHHPSAPSPEPPGSVFYGRYFVTFVLIVAVFKFIPIIVFSLLAVAGPVVAFGTVWLFFLAASRLAYVRRVMLVEGQALFSGTVSRL